MRKAWAVALIACIFVLAPPWLGQGLAAPGGPVLVAEFHDFFFTNGAVGPGDVTVDHVEFVLGYNIGIDGNGILTLSDAMLGPETPENLFISGDSALIDLHSDNSPYWDNVVSHLTNGETEDIWSGMIFYTEDEQGNKSILNVPLVIGARPESAALDGINTGPDLNGFDIDVVRLVVNDLWYEVTSSGIDYEYDIVWQFWSGSNAGGGQRSDVDDFLTFVTPVDSQTVFPSRVTSYPVTIQYGDTIDPFTFQAVLNGADIKSDFNPFAGIQETVDIVLDPGRNTLKLQVEGQREDGRFATDRDTLTFINP